MSVTKHKPYVILHNFEQVMTLIMNAFQFDLSKYTIRDLPILIAGRREKEDSSDTSLDVLYVKPDEVATEIAFDDFNPNDLIPNQTNYIYEGTLGGFEYIWDSLSDRQKQDKNIMLNVGHLATLVNEKAVSDVFEYFDINAGTKLTADNVAKIKAKFYQQSSFLPVGQIVSISQVTDVYMVDNHAFDTSNLLYPLTQVLSIMDDNFLQTPDYTILGRDKQPLMLPVCVKSHKPEKYYFVSFDYNLYNHD